MRRLLLVVGLSVIALGSVGGVARAAEGMVDQATCEGGTDPSPSTRVSGGTWDAATSTCTAEYAQVADGDHLTIPEGTTLVVGFWMDAALGGHLINRGTLVATNTDPAISPVGAISSGAITNYGLIQAHSLHLIDLPSTPGAFGTFDNWGSLVVAEEIENEGDSFLNRCGATVEAGSVVGAPLRQEACPETTTTLASTTTAAQATTTDELPFTGTESDALLAGLALIAVGLLIVTAARAR